MLFKAAQAYRDGTGSFADFALECARTSSGARDYEEGRDKSDGYAGFLSPEYQADTSRPVLERLRAELAEVQSWDKATAEAKARANYEVQLADYQQSLARHQAQQQRHKAMCAEVEAWQPPTPNHDGVKQHMLFAIANSEQNQPGEPIRPQLSAGKHYKNERIKSLTYAIDEVTEIGTTIEEQRQRYDEWMRVLRQSLGLPAGETPQQ
jgi:hypothetical protein